MDIKFKSDDFQPVSQMRRVDLENEVKRWRECFNDEVKGEINYLSTLGQKDVGAFVKQYREELKEYLNRHADSRFLFNDKKQKNWLLMLLSWELRKQIPWSVDYHYKELKKAMREHGWEL